VTRKDLCEHFFYHNEFPKKLSDLNYTKEKPRVIEPDQDIEEVFKGLKDHRCVIMKEIQRDSGKKEKPRLFMVTPKVVALAVRKHTQRFTQIENLEEKIREIIIDFLPVEFESYDYKCKSLVKKRLEDPSDVGQLSFSVYQKLLIPRIEIHDSIKNIQLSEIRRLFDNVTQLRNEIMHMRFSATNADLAKVRGLQVFLEGLFPPKKPDCS
jgi:hypothetical protein